MTCTVYVYYFLHGSLFTQQPRGILSYDQDLREVLPKTCSFLGCAWIENELDTGVLRWDLKRVTDNPVRGLQQGWWGIIGENILSPLRLPDDYPEVSPASGSRRTGNFILSRFIPAAPGSFVSSVGLRLSGSD